jgi:hypothetical protein
MVGFNKPVGRVSDLSKPRTNHPAVIAAYIEQHTLRRLRERSTRPSIWVLRRVIASSIGIISARLPVSIDPVQALRSE